MNPHPGGNVIFGPFRLDVLGGRLLKGERPVALRRKAWEVLRVLAERAGEIVSGEELLARVWPGIAVTPQTVTNVIHELRVALDDAAGPSRWIQTVHRRGHVFLPWGPADAPRAPLPAVVARDAEIALLLAIWAKACGGERQVAFVIGEPGIGKTTLVDAFRARVDGDAGGVWVTCGGCVEQQARPEAYQPVLSAIDRIAAGARQREICGVLRAHAPTWLFQIPRLLRADERKNLERALVATTSSRMLREGLALIHALARDRPLLLVLEDLHWADDATLDFVGAIARAGQPLRLLLVATCRPADPAMQEYRVVALLRALARERRAHELRVAPFDRDAVAAYLDARLGDETVPATFCDRLTEQSAGNPLFLRALVDELVERRALVSDDTGWRLTDDADSKLEELPSSLRNAVQTAVASLPDELREVIEVASVAGNEIDALEVAVASGIDPLDVERHCERLAQAGRLLLRSSDGVAPDRTALRRYAFTHPSHRRIVYDLLPPMRRRALHRRLAVGLESLHREDTDSLAHVLASHFEQGGQADRAVFYLERAASKAEAAYAYRAAAEHVGAALDKCDDGAAVSSDRAAAIGELHLRRGSFLVLADGYSTPEVERAYDRARELFATAGVAEGRFVAEMGLGAYHMTRARYARAREVSDRLIGLSDNRVPAFGAIARCWSAFVSSATGEIARARSELLAGLALPEVPNVPRNFDTHRMMESQLALVLAVGGEEEASRARARSALARSEAAGTVPDVGHARMLAAEHAVFLKDTAAGEGIASAAVAHARANDFKSYLALCLVYAAVLSADRPVAERIATIRDVITQRARLGDRWHESLVRASLAELELARGNTATALDELELAGAHVEETGERYYLAEILRLRAECLLASADTDDSREAAARLLETAIAIADAQGAALWTQRASASLDRLKERRTP